MQKNIIFCLVLTLTVVCFAESSAVDAGAVEFDNLIAENLDLGYEDDEPNWGAIFSKLIARTTPKPTTVRTKTIKKKRPAVKNVDGQFIRGDVNKFFDVFHLQDYADYEDENLYGKVDGVAAAAAVTKAKETTTHARGNKTTGFHRIQHKDEYNKKREFYDINETKGVTNKADAKASGKAVSAGAGFNRSSFNKNRHAASSGQSGNLDSGIASTKQFNEFKDFEDFKEDFDTEIDM